MPLTAKQRRYLRSLAHHRPAIVQIGHAGITPGVLAQLNAALETHELVKVRLGKECPVDVAEARPELQAGTASEAVSRIGRTLVVYRRREKDPAIQLPV